MTARDSQPHEHFEELAVSHALSALEPEDEQEFLLHLPVCPPCQRAVVEHQATLAHFAYAADLVEPPPALLDGIRAGVAASGRAGSFPPPLAPSASVVSLDAARARRRPGAKAMAVVTGVAASLVAVSGLLVANHSLQTQDDKLQAANRALTGTVKTLVTDGARTVQLTGNDGGRAVAVVKGQSLSLVATGLVPNDPAKSVYVLWEKSRFGDVRPVGTFDVRDGSVTVVPNLKLVRGAGDVSALMVTHELGRKAPAMSTRSVVISGNA